MPACGRTITSFAIVTTEANALVAPIHNRMPVILPSELEAVWLDYRTSVLELQRMLAPYPAGHIASYPVTRLVNQAGHDLADAVLPAAG